MCGGGSKSAAPPPPLPAADPKNTADRGADNAGDASLRPQAPVTTATSGLGGEQSGSGTTSVLGG
jgi:hypothetical protein